MTKELDARHQIGGNNPPEELDAIDAVTGEHADTLDEAANWLDGEPITTEAQMKAVDAIIKAMRTAGADLTKAKKAATDPLHKAWKAEGERWKPTEADFERIKKGLVDLVAPLKAKIATEKEAAKRAAYEAARKAEHEAEESARKAQTSNLEAQREADALKQAAIDAKKAASAANKDTVKGLRTVWKHEIDDMRALVNWIATNDKAAMAEFATEYARQNHRDKDMAGVRSWQTEEAY